jgi:SNF2 family DNA or RNA helicase
MGAEFVHKHGQAGVLDCNACSVIPGCTVAFLDSQINGAVWMVQKSTGQFPLAPGMSDNSNAIAAAEQISGIQTFGGLLVDGMGLGKTFTALLFLAYYAAYCPKIHGHRPTLILVPGGVVLCQWVQAFKQFPSLTMLLVHGERPTDPALRSIWVSHTAMRQTPDNTAHWPHNYKYVWDRYNPQASSVVLLSTPDTWASRALDNAVGTYPDTGKSYTYYTSSCGERIGVSIIDEGHRFKNMRTKIYHSIKQLHTLVNWFLTGTPVQYSHKVRMP